MTHLDLRADLPHPVATHFGPGGEADGFMSVTATLAFTVGMQVALGGLLAALATTARHAIPGARAIMGLPAGMAAFIGALVVATLLPQRGLDTAEAATLGGGVLAVAAVLAWVAGPVVVLPVMLLPLGALLASLRFSVTIGPAGVGVRGALGWPRTLLSIDTITHADVEHVTPMAYGGWGWRVTVDDADRAAGVVNQLVDRREGSRAAEAS